MLHLFTCRQDLKEKGRPHTKGRRDVSESTNVASARGSGCRVTRGLTWDRSASSAT